jgi:galactokinase/mevalonate kinase-like predicted kinase
VTRNSKKVLKSVTDNLYKVKPLLDTVDTAQEAIIDSNTQRFFQLMGDSWKQKKETSSTITENERIKQIDEELENNPTILAHKLCGAGNGGFFLTFSEKGQLTTELDSVRINLTVDGVSGESI